MKAKAKRKVPEITCHRAPRRTIYEETYRLLKKLPTAGSIKSCVCRHKGPI